MTFLNKILESKREQIEDLESVKELQSRLESSSRADVRNPMWSNNLDVIAEIKRKSPSKGDLAKIDDPAGLAEQYCVSGAVAISVLTDQHYFGARPDDFERVRNRVSTPLLRKDFIIDDRQVYETFLMGADIMLLIVAAFDDMGLLKNLHGLARNLKMNVLLEIHTRAELETANELGAEIIGVNVRDLSSFDENPLLGDEIIKEIDRDATSVWESSISNIDDAKRARKAGADCVLVGQALVSRDNPGEFIEQIRSIS